MGDIVERLRAQTEWHVEDAIEAADEIERLRSVLQDFYDWCGKDYPGWPAVEAALGLAADFIQKIRQEMATISDPLRDAMMNALCSSRDPRIMAVRRKCSFDQLRAIVDCAALAKATKP